MKLDEILNEDIGSLVTPNIPPFNPKYSGVVGMMDGYDVWASREFHGRDVYAFRDPQGNVISMVHINSAPVETKLYTLAELWTSPSHRGKGLATMLLIFLLRKVNVKLLLAHNEVLSADARQTLLKGLKANRFKIFDRTGTPVDVDTVEQAFNRSGKTADEFVLSEEQTNISKYNNKKITEQHLAGEWYLIRGTPDCENGLLD